MLLTRPTLGLVGFVLRPPALVAPLKLADHIFHPDLQRLGCGRGLFAARFRVDTLWLVDGWGPRRS